jgi:hypothetical protein
MLSVLAVFVGVWVVFVFGLDYMEVISLIVMFFLLAFSIGFFSKSVELNGFGDCFLTLVSYSWFYYWVYFNDNLMAGFWLQISILGLVGLLAIMRRKTKVSNEE